MSWRIRTSALRRGLSGRTNRSYSDVSVHVAGVEIISTQNAMSPRCLLYLFGLFGFALGLRLWGIAFGLPFPYHPDEPAHVLQALAIVRGLPDGVTFANPPLYKYLLSAEYAAVYVIGWLTGAYASPQDFIDQFRANPTLLYLVARVTSAVLGAATTFAAYALAAAVRGRQAGLLAAWLAAVTYILVRESHFAVNDALVILFTTWALYGAVRILEKGDRRAYVLAGVATGLAFAAKYHGLVAVFPLVVAHALRPKRSQMDLFLGLGAAAAAVLIGFPSLSLETGRVVNDIYVQLYSRGGIGYDGMDPTGGYFYYLKALIWGLGWPTLLVALAGALLAALPHNRSLIVVATLPLALYAIMGYERMYFARYMLPAVPALLVLAAVAVHTLARSLHTSVRFREHAVLLFGAVLIGAPSLVDSVRFDAILAKEDTRTVSRAWIESRLPQGANVAIDWFPFGPTLTPGRYNLLEANGWSLFDLTVDAHRRRGVEYIVASSYAYDLRLLDREKDARRRTFYEELGRDAEVIAEFRPYIGDQEWTFVYDQIYAPFDHLERLERPGPTIKVYRISRPEAYDDSI